MRTEFKNGLIKCNEKVLWHCMSNMKASIVISIVFLIPSCYYVSALPNGAPTDACDEITPGHGFDPTDCGASCPFSLTLTEIDGSSVSGAQQQMYRCGSRHTSESLKLAVHYRYLY